MLPKHQQQRLKADRREAQRKRTAKCRNLKVEKSVIHDSASFKSTSAFSKALSRARKALEPALPKTPKRKSAVFRRLFTEIGDPQPSNSTATVPESQQNQKGLSEATVLMVKAFYERDDISRQAPGRKDSKKILQEDGTRYQVQVRHLTFSILEAYALFKEEYPNVKIGKSKFADLRPKHVLLQNKLPHNVCLCRYHENFILAVNALHKAYPGNIPNYTYDLPETFLCSDSTPECWMNNCTDCKDGQGFRNSYQVPDQCSDISWYVWKYDNEGKLVKSLEEGSTDDLRFYIITLIPQFLQHCYTKREQSKVYKQQRANMDPHQALIQVDFSENFTCGHQDKIQSAHWHQNQISLFTAAIWHSGNINSTVLVSDNLVHSKDTILAYLDKLLEDIPETIKTASIWSDGPASQFKNRFIVASLSALQSKHKLAIDWNYFATSHGKGPVDGIGGTIKRFVWSAVKARKIMVQNASSFVEAAKQSKVKVTEINTSEIVKRNSSLNLDQVFNDAPTIKGIANYHHIVITENGPELFNLTKDRSSRASQLHASHSPQTQDSSIKITPFKVGSYVAAVYHAERQWYVGVIEELQSEEAVISFLHPGAPGSTTTCTWPIPVDKCLVPFSNILCTCSPPFPISSTGRAFRISPEDFKPDIKILFEKWLKMF